MEQNDTINLLRECDAGTKMALSSLDEVSDKVQNPYMKELLTKSKEQHVKLGHQLHHMLLDHQSPDKEPNPIAKGMSQVKTNLKLGWDQRDSVVADLLTDGCHMGIKSLHRYLNQYRQASQSAKHVCRSIVEVEEELAQGLRVYL